MLELYELQVFLVAAATENFSEAGRRLQMSQPAVSGHIHALEERLKVQLFERTGRNIKLNDVGQALVPVARKLLKEAELLEEFVASQRGSLTGHLLLGCSTAAGKYILPRIMARFQERHPDVKIACQVGPRGQALDDLVEGKVDLAVSSLRVPRRAIEYHHFADDELVLIVPPDHVWASRENINPVELLDYPLILREPSSGTMFTLNRALAEADLSLDMLPSNLTLWNSEAIVQAVSVGIGAGFVSSITAELALQHHIVVQVPIVAFAPVQSLYMARHTGFSASEAQTVFWEFTFASENMDLRPII
ncbi:MAG: LysR family transcriptional regulator [Chloroflexi bacterium]|nr:LysR family transcriptional regulator [Chloroflexota bacterium]